MKLISPIFTERLILREIEESDYKQIHCYFSSPDVMRFMEHGATTEEDTLNYLKRVIEWQKAQPRIHLVLGVVLKTEGILIGGCDLHMPNFRHRQGELVYRINPQYWGQGYATEASKAMLNLGFNQMKLHRIEALCDVRNTASIKVLEKIGMKKEGFIREHKWVKERWRDSVLYSILEQEFSPI